MTREPELYYLKLPEDIKNYRVILMDAAVATGAAAMMAIRGKDHFFSYDSALSNRPDAKTQISLFFEDLGF